MHRPTLAYYEANASRFFEETRKDGMGTIYEPFLSLLPPVPLSSTPGADRAATVSTFFRKATG